MRSSRTTIGVVVERDERVRLGVVGGGTPASGRVGDGAEALHAALAVVPLADDVEQVAVREALRGEVVGVDEHDATAGLDAAVAVVEP